MKKPVLVLLGICMAIWSAQSYVPAWALRASTDDAVAIQNQQSNTQYDVLTQHNDMARTGAATHEDVLTPASVKSGRFGYLGSVPVEGKIYAQPLYVENAAVTCSADGGAASPRNVNITYVVTLQNMVYAIDVNRRTVCWKTQLPGGLQPGNQLLGIDPQIEGGIGVGVVSTPVIDLNKNVIYVVARVFDASQVHFVLHTLDTRTGTVLARVQLDETETCNGQAFQPHNHNNRPGLLLVDDKLFMAFGSTAGEDDAVKYHGFVFGFDVTNPAQPVMMPQAFCSTPNGTGGGIWMSGGGLASDGSAIYLITGNGAYHLGPNGDLDHPETQIPQTPKPGNYPDSFVKLNVADLSVSAGHTDVRKQNQFTSIPYNFGDPNRTIFWARERSDADLGSGGVLLLGNRVIGGGKDGRIDVLDTNGLASKQSFLAFFDADTNQGTQAAGFNTYGTYQWEWYAGPNIHGGPVAWDVRARAATPYIYVYAWSEKDYLKRFTFDPASGAFLDARDATPADPAPTPYGPLKSPYKSMPGGMLSISSNGATDGIVWGVVEEPFPTARGFSSRCNGSQNGQLVDCMGCYLTNGKFVEYCDATQGYVPGRLYAFAADANGAGFLPILWGDKRTANPNNLIPRYAKFTPPTIAHGTVILATGNDEVRFYGLRACTPPNCDGHYRRGDDLMAAWNDGGSATFALYPSTLASPANPVKPTAFEGFEAHTAWRIRDGGWGDSIRWLSGDYDGDGLSDVAAVWNDGGLTTLTVRLRQGGSGRAAEHWLIRDRPWNDATKWVAGDFDGDGMTDIAAIYKDGNAASISVYQSTGAGFARPVTWLLRDGGWGDSIRWISGDFNGDGLSDIVAIWDDGGTNTLTVRQSTGSSFHTKHWDIHDGGWLDSTQWLAGDFDGDGLTDIAAAWNDGGSATFAVFRSTGTQFQTHTAWAVRDGGWDDTIHWVSGDFNADGRADILAIWNDGGMNTLSVRQSTGTQFIAKHWRLQDGGWMDTTAWLSGKFR